jgi:hypothetical protein
VKTYSPLLDEWETDGTSEFMLFYNMSGQLLSSIEDQITNEGMASDSGNGEDFTIIVIPDTQYYSESFPDIFKAQMQWVVDNRDARNIVYVAHVGDIVNRDYDIHQWQVADSAMKIMENAVFEGFPDGIPYGIAPGNHDFPKVSKIINLYNVRMMLYPNE